MDVALIVLSVALALVVGAVVGTALERRRRRGDEGGVREMVASISRDVAREAREDLDEKQRKALEESRKDIDLILRPFKEQLDKLQRSATELEAKREGAYRKLQAHLEALQGATVALDQHSRSLATTLRGSSSERGKWGEMALRNIVELAGMLPHCDFFEQQADASGRRPDMVVRIPRGGTIPVDSKVPLASYEKALAEGEAGARGQHMQAHARALREHVRALASRDYSSAAEGRIDFTVMFVPAEPIFSAAWEADPDLYAFAHRHRVLITTPVTFLALMQTVGTLWQLTKEAESSRLLVDATRTFRDRVRVFAGHFGKIGSSLESAVKHFNAAVGSYESRVLPQGQKVEQFVDAGHVGPGDKLPELGPIETAPRAFAVEADADATSPGEDASAEDGAAT